LLTGRRWRVGKPTQTRVESLALVRVIDPNAVMRLDELRAVLGLPLTCLRREARLGRLRVSRRSRRYWTTGRWIQQWIEDGEVKPRARPGVNDRETPAAGT
jgi:hypothetical protein